MRLDTTAARWARFGARASLLLLGWPDAGHGQRESTPKERRATFPAVLASGNVALIKSKYDERVAEVAVRVGSRVAKGQLLVRLVDDEQRVLQGRTAAVLARARAELERVRGMHVQHGVSDERLEDAQTAVQLAEADHDLARIRCEERSFLAPFDGVVSERHVDPGTSVEAGDPLVKLAALTPLRLEALLPEAMLPALSRRVLVEIHLASPETTLTVALRPPAVVVDPASGTFPLQLEIDNTARRLVPGVSCRIAIRQPAESSP